MNTGWWGQRQRQKISYCPLTRDKQITRGRNSPQQIIPQTPAHFLSAFPLLLQSLRAIIPSIHVLFYFYIMLDKIKLEATLICEWGGTRVISTREWHSHVGVRVHWCIPIELTSLFVTLPKKISEATQKEVPHRSLLLPLLQLTHAIIINKNPDSLLRIKQSYASLSYVSNVTPNLNQNRSFPFFLNQDIL